MCLAETEEEKSLRLERARMHKLNQHANETEEEKALRVEKERSYARQRYADRRRSATKQQKVVDDC